MPLSATDAAERQPVRGIPKVGERTFTHKVLTGRVWWGGGGRPLSLGFRAAVWKIAWENGEDALVSKRGEPGFTSRHGDTLPLISALVRHGQVDSWGSLSFPIWAPTISLVASLTLPYVKVLSRSRSHRTVIFLCGFTFYNF